MPNFREERENLKRKKLTTTNLYARAPSFSQFACQKRKTKDNKKGKVLGVEFSSRRVLYLYYTVLVRRSPKELLVNYQSLLSFLEGSTFLENKINDPSPPVTRGNKDYFFVNFYCMCVGA